MWTEESGGWVVVRGNEAGGKREMEMRQERRRRRRRKEMDV